MYQKQKQKQKQPTLSGHHVGHRFHDWSDDALQDAGKPGCQLTVGSLGCLRVSCPLSHGMFVGKWAIETCSRDDSTGSRGRRSGGWPANPASGRCRTKCLALSSRFCSVHQRHISSMCSVTCVELAKGAPDNRYRKASLVNLE